MSVVPNHRRSSPNSCVLVLLARRNAFNAKNAKSGSGEVIIRYRSGETRFVERPAHRSSFLVSTVALPCTPEFGTQSKLPLATSPFRLARRDKLLLCPYRIIIILGTGWVSNGGVSGWEIE
ncbi:hypothetical protein YH62_26085 [Rhizobium sp. LC145]|nr:hypothetical protein YH62_26085 [Rhizobium sp. LC145]